MIFNIILKHAFHLEMITTIMEEQHELIENLEIRPQSFIVFMEKLLRIVAIRRVWKLKQLSRIVILSPFTLNENYKSKISI